MSFWGRAARTSRSRLLSLRGNSWWRSVSSEATSSRAVVAGGGPRIGSFNGEKRSNPYSSSMLRSSLAQFISIRSFAAPVSAKKAKEKDTDAGPRLNEDIMAAEVRLVSDDGHSIVTRGEALSRAKTLGLDLVEVNPLANPPVCKIMDYHQERSKKAAKDKERAKSKAETSLRTGDCKEVRFSGKIEKKDLEMKAETVKRLMESGYRVKITAEAAKKAGSSEEDLGSVLSRLYKLIEDISAVEGAPRVEKRVAYVIVRHAKFGTKKNPAKKVSSTNETNGIKQTPHHQKEDSDGIWKKEKVLKTSQSDLRTPVNSFPTHQINVPSSGKARSPASPTNLQGIRNEQNCNQSDHKSVPGGAKPELDSNSESQRNRYAATPSSSPLPELGNRYKKSSPTGRPTRSQMQPQQPPFRGRNDGMLNSNQHRPPGDPNNREGFPLRSSDRHQNHNRYPPNTNYHGPNPPKSFGRFDPRQDSSSNPTRRRDQENAP